VCGRVEGKREHDKTRLASENDCIVEYKLTNTTPAEPPPTTHDKKSPWITTSSWIVLAEHRHPTKPSITTNNRKAPLC
jgi:hypothetical protein